MKKIIFVVLVVFILTGCNNSYIKDINVLNNTISVYDDFYLSDFKFDKDIKILNNEKINTNHIGDMEITTKVLYNNKKYNYKLKYNIVDNTPPIFINSIGYKKVKLHDKLNPCDLISTADNYDRNVKCSIEGLYDLDNVGKYEVEYLIKDSSNNETKQNLTIDVVEEIISVPNNNQTKYIDFKDIIKDYKSNTNMIGIDISRWQEEIDFKKIKEEGCEFVMIRMGVDMKPNEDLEMDSYFIKNITGAKEAGLMVGVYVYTTATNKVTALRHAKWVEKNLKPYTIDLGVAYDFERWSKFNTYNMNLKDLNNNYKVFSQYMKNKGYNPILYGSKSYLERVWDETNDDVWLAHYTLETNYKKPLFLWQMTDKGKIDGIKGPVDIDILYKK